MLIIKPIQEKKEQEELCALCGCEYDVDCLAYGAFVDEKFVGICQFIYRADGAHIVSLRQARGEDDLDALFIMGRQAMNFIDLSGTRKAWYDDVTGGMTADFIYRLGFDKRDDGNSGTAYFVDLTGFFENPCVHGKAGSATSDE